MSVESWPLWLTGLSAEARGLLCDAMERMGFASHAQVLAAVDGAPLIDARSRQARHALVTRARSSAAISVLMLAPKDAALRALLFSREGSWLRPFCSEAYTKARSLPAMLATSSARACHDMFDEAAALLLERGPRVAADDDLDALRLHSAFAAMSVAAIVHGRGLATSFLGLRDEAEARGLFDNPHLRVRLAMLGAWTGCEEDLEELLLDEAMRDARLADAYCFVRSDLRGELYETAANLVRGQYVAPSAFLTGTRPASTLRQGLDYVIARLRELRNVKSPAQMLMLLTALDDSLHLLAEQRRCGKVSADALDLLLRLRTLEQVQRMDKARFWGLYDDASDGAVKQRIGELWNMDHRAACEGVLAPA